MNNRDFALSENQLEALWYAASIMELLHERHAGDWDRSAAQQCKAMIESLRALPKPYDRPEVVFTLSGSDAASTWLVQMEPGFICVNETGSIDLGAGPDTLRGFEISAGAGERAEVAPPECQAEPLMCMLALTEIVEGEGYGVGFEPE